MIDPWLQTLALIVIAACWGAVVGVAIERRLAARPRPTGQTPPMRNPPAPPPAPGGDR